MQYDDPDSGGLKAEHFYSTDDREWGWLNGKCPTCGEAVQRPEPTGPWRHTATGLAGC